MDETSPNVDRPPMLAFRIFFLKEKKNTVDGDHPMVLD
jgi:hypothetical protein